VLIYCDLFMQRNDIQPVFFRTVVSRAVDSMRLDKKNTS